MKKAMIIFGGSRFAEGAFEFARKLNELQPLLLVCNFISEASYTALWLYTDPPLTTEFIPLVDKEIKAMKENIRKFETACRENKIEYRVHADFVDFLLADLKTKTRFTDLLIISSDK